MLNAMRPTQNTVSVYLVVIACRGRDASTMISYGEGYCDASIVAGCDMSQPVTPVPTFFPKNRSWVRPNGDGRSVVVRVVPSVQGPTQGGGYQHAAHQVLGKSFCGVTVAAVAAT